ncbi:hypothetical protein SOVF_160120 [Spinacia oleracea]|nr:hypothetical protein SOVF_160120 [Spinacia oleracea]
MRDKLPHKVILKSPGGAAWEVRLMRDNNDTFFSGDGWKEFAKAHNFKENDLLVFKYIRESCFKVLVFGGGNLCEKADSYFVKKSVLGKNDAGENSQLKRKSTNERTDKVVGNDEELLLETDDSDNEKDAAEASRRKSRRRHSICSLRNNGADVEPHTPNNVPLSAADKARAMQLASQETTNESFTVVMKASNVSFYYRLRIPSPWARTYLTRKNQYMDLRADGRKWTVRFNTEPRYGGGVLVTGWYKFAIDNLLQEFDVCLFKLVSQKGEPVVFDVSIYRAAP